MKIIYTCFPAFGHIDWGGVTQTLNEFTKRGHTVFVATGPYIKNLIIEKGFDFLDIKLKPFKLCNNETDIKSVLIRHLHENFYNLEELEISVELLSDFIEKNSVDLILSEPYLWSGYIVAKKYNIPHAAIILENRILPAWYKKHYEMLFLQLQKFAKKNYRITVPNSRNVIGNLNISYICKDFYGNKPIRKTLFCGANKLSKLKNDGHRPLIYYSSGTLFGNIEQLHEILETAMRNPNIDFLISGGKGLQNVSPSANITFVDFIDEEKELSRIDVAISQAGIGTMTKAIRASVPIIALPLYFGNEPISLAVDKLECGIMIKTYEQKYKNIEKAIYILLENKSYKKNILALSEKFHQCGGAETAFNTLNILINNYGKKERKSSNLF